MGDRDGLRKKKKNPADEEEERKRRRTRGGGEEEGDTERGRGTGKCPDVTSSEGVQPDVPALISKVTQRSDRRLTRHISTATSRDGGRSPASAASFRCGDVQPVQLSSCPASLKQLNQNKPN